MHPQLFRNVEAEKITKGAFIAECSKKMIKKLEETESLTIRAGREHKPLSEDVITNVATAIVEKSLGTFADTSSARGVAWKLIMSYSTVWRVLRRIIGFYSYKISR